MIGSKKIGSGREQDMRMNRYLIFSLLAGVSACGEPEKITRQVSPFEVSGTKVLLDETSSTGKGTALAVLLDEKCARKKPRTHVLRPLHLQNSGKGYSRSRIQTYRVELAEPMEKSRISELAEQDPCIRGVSHSRSFQPNTVDWNDPLIQSQTHLKALAAIESFPLLEGDEKSRSVTIAIIDTGIDLKHPDLSERLWVNAREKAGKPGVDDDGNGFVDDIHGFNFPDESGDPSHRTVNDHGTHVAGLSAAASGNATGGVGIAGQGSRIMALNVFGRGWNADTVSIDRAIRYAVDNGADVINISIGGFGRSDTTADAMVYALNKGIPIVVSVGNEGADLEKNFYSPASYAASYSGLIGVSASDAASGALCDFVNRSPRVAKLMAPGCDSGAPKNGLLSTRSGSRYGHKKGTSMAAPLVAGTIALIRMNLPRATPSRIEEVLIQASVRHDEWKDSVAEGRSLSLKLLAETLQ